MTDPRPALDPATIDSLFPADLEETGHWESAYPPRNLPAGAQVTRFGPSPTGFVHIGGLYVASIDQDLAKHSAGVCLLRIEDTDQAREVEGALDQFNRAFDYFGIRYDEGPQVGAYGPYHQSQRERIYLSYARHLLRTGKAYLCFASKEELADISERQKAAKVPPGYYGPWALWREADATAIQARLAEGAHYVVRFRAPEGSPERTSFVDAIRGTVEHEANRNDAVILKSSDQSPRLPTYHFAHAVDDHLMRVTTVIRGDEWISSVPLHQQLFEALDFEPVTYAHLAPLTKQIPGGKRKLSKRKDAEATVDYYLDAGYPAKAVLYYLRGLANANLAELNLEEALDTPLDLNRFGVSGPLVDLVKLEDISADHIATLSGREILVAVKEWAQERDSELFTVLEVQEELALRALAVEREGTANPRKDLRKWSDFRGAYGFFFNELLDQVTDLSDARLGALGVPANSAGAFLDDLAQNYKFDQDPATWFAQIREGAVRHGFAASPKEYKANPGAYCGSVREAAQLVRLALTGSDRSPDLHAIAGVLPDEVVTARIGQLAACMGLGRLGQIVSSQVYLKNVRRESSGGREYREPPSA